MGSREEVQRTIAFVDLAGFTALTDAHGDSQATDIQQAFVTALGEALADSVECVKHLGDGALLAARDAVDMFRCLSALARDWSMNPHAPLARAGVYAGPVLRVPTGHGVDYLGRTVNIAARLCELAVGGQLVHSDRLIPDLVTAGLTSHRIGPRTLRGISEPITVGLVELTATVGLPIDPVCRMPVPAGTGAGSIEHGGTLWSFCSPHCAALFAGSPHRYALPQAPPDHADRRS